MIIKTKLPMKKTIFVYGTLMRNHGNNMYLSSSEFIGSAITVDKYVLSANFIPFVTNEPEHQYATNIKGEVYHVEERVFKSIDLLEGHPQHYRRSEVNVRLDDLGAAVSAWLYFHPIHGTIIQDGSYNTYVGMRRSRFI